MSAAISIENEKMALVCFDDFSYKKCELFDSKTSRSTFKTSYQHGGGKIGLYRGKPTTVGSDRGKERNKVETLSLSGWRILNDFPKRY